MQEIKSDHTARNEKIDALIIAAASAEWQKVALIISKVFEADGFDKLGVKAADVADRLYILVDAGQLSVEGNMRRWRDSDVKLAG